MGFERIRMLLDRGHGMARPKGPTTPAAHNSIAAKVSPSMQRSRDGEYTADLCRRLRRHRNVVRSD